MTVELAEIAALTAKMEATDHIGRHNRLFTRRSRLFDAIDADPERLALLRTLLEYPQSSVRMVAAWRCGWRQVLLDEAERVVTELAEQRDEIGREAQSWLESRTRMASEYRREQPPPRTLSYDSMPAGCSRAAATELISGSVPEERARTFLPLLRRAIRIWPRAHADDPGASCFGGLPMLPEGCAWPSCEDEPSLFLGQINCAELHAAVGANPFPKRGLLQFYGDHDEVNGCGPGGLSAVLYFPDLGALHPAPAPIVDFVELPGCGVEFYETVELPDPLSDLIARLQLSPGEKKAYADLRGKLAALGGDAGQWPDRPSKLLGWPDLIQRDLGEDFGEIGAGEALFLQIGSYHDGAEWQDWGPGGLVYFILSETAIAEARFERAAMEMQCK